MFAKPTRRRFLQTVASGSALLGLGDLSDFLHLASAAPEQVNGSPWEVRYGADIEPIVRLIEEAPREKCVEVLAEQLRRGLSYRRFMAAVFLAGLRNGGDLGYYHCVYMVHSANQLSLDAPVGECLLAMFGALDVFKDWQSRRATEPSKFGLQRMPDRLPSPEQATREFQAGMDAGDPDAAERAIIPLVRSQGRQRVFDLIARYGFRDEGVHSWIFAANAWRCLTAIGGEYTEPVLRALVRNVGGNNDWYLPQREKANKMFGPLPAGWAQASGDPGFTRELLAVMRNGNTEQAFDFALRELNQGKVRAGAVWDAVHLAAGEAFLRGNSGNGLHANTGLNALHYAFQTTTDSENRLLILMRAVTFMCHPISAFPTAKSPLNIIELEPVDIPASPEVAAEEILSSAARDGAVGKAFAFAQHHPDSPAYWQARRRHVVMKADDAHPYKFLAAIWEDSQLVSPRWRPHLVAASVGQSDGTPLPDSTVMLQARRALRKL